MKKARKPPGDVIVNGTLSRMPLPYDTSELRDLPPGSYRVVLVPGAPGERPRMVPAFPREVK